VSVDYSQINRLREKFAHQAEAMPKIAEDEVDDIGEEVASEARGIAAGYPKGTGALAAAVRVIRVGSAVVSVGAAVREAFYLEVGSPNTGAPRPWLTGPATRALEELLERMSKKAVDF